MKTVIELEGVTKEFKVLNRREGLLGSIKDLISRDYRYLRAVDGVTMKIQEGEIVGYLGPNGAGKSTTIKVMTGVLEPTSGKVLVNGKVPFKNRTENAQNIGVVFGQRTQLWWSLPVIESFKILRDMYQVKEKDYQDMMELYRSLVNIDEILHKPVRQMSLGQRTLSDILAAFLHNPSVVFLDEPTIGLDVSMKSKIRELIQGLNKEKNTTVILTTHDMGDVDALCRRIVIIDKGKMLYDNDMQHLHRFFGAYRTLKICLSKNSKDFGEDFTYNQAEMLKEKILTEFPLAKSLVVSTDKEWINILINEDEVELMKVLNYLQGVVRIYNMMLDEISTESVIKKIYEGVML